MREGSLRNFIADEIGVIAFFFVYHMFQMDDIWSASPSYETNELYDFLLISVPGEFNIGESCIAIGC